MKGTTTKYQTRDMFIIEQSVETIITSSELDVSIPKQKRKKKKERNFLMI